MNLHVKSLWTEALRSGKYTQSEGRLRTSEGYCCLGVLCDIYRKETGLGRWLSVEGGKHVFHLEGGERRVNCLPRRVSKWAGLEFCRDPSDPIVCGSALSRHNDSVTHFDDIARMIEEEL